MASFFVDWWHHHIRDFALSWFADLVKGLLVMLGLLITYGFVRVMASMGYSAEYLHSFEELHFWSGYATILILCLSFVLRLAVAAVVRKH